MGNTEQLAELLSSLEQAILMAQQIGSQPSNKKTNSSKSTPLSSFLSTIPSAASQKSLSSVEPMQLGEEEENCEAEEKMRECFIRNKRVKRPLSPSSAVVDTSAMEERSVREHGFDFDPHASKSRALDLIYQFHG